MMLYVDTKTGRPVSQVFVEGMIRKGADPERFVQAYPTDEDEKARLDAWLIEKVKRERKGEQE